MANWNNIIQQRQYQQQLENARKFDGLKMANNTDAETMAGYALGRYLGDYVRRGFQRNADNDAKGATNPVTLEPNTNNLFGIDTNLGNVAVNNANLPTSATQQFTNEQLGKAVMGSDMFKENAGKVLSNAPAEKLFGNFNADLADVAAKNIGGGVDQIASNVAENVGEVVGNAGEAAKGSGGSFGDILGYAGALSKAANGDTEGAVKDAALTYGASLLGPWGMLLGLLK